MRKKFEEYEKAYFEYLKGKEVVIVGPAEYMMGLGRGEQIDKYDVIVRLNNSFPLSSNLHKDLGSRTDVLYHTCTQVGNNLAKVATKTNTSSIGVLERDGVKWFVAKHHPTESSSRPKKKFRTFARLNEGSGIRLVPTHVNFLEKIRRELDNTDPNTGLLAIKHLLLSKLKTLTIMGCDYQITGYYPGYTIADNVIWVPEKKIFLRRDGRPRRKSKRGHNKQKQVVYLSELVEKESRLIINDQLKKALKEWA